MSKKNKNNSQKNRKPKGKKVQLKIKPKPKRKGNKRALFREAGGMIGSMIGSERLGRAAGAAIGRIFGSGDYAVKQNSFLGGGPPSFTSLKTGYRISHREYLGDVSTSTSWNLTQYKLNPAESGTFPWLSSLAVCFEQYKFHGLVFYFNSTSATAVSSTNTALGTVGMVTQYDPTDPPFASKLEAESYQGCVASVPSKSLLHYVECAPKTDVLDQFFVRSGDIGNEDLKFYDPGVFSYFSTGAQANSVAGELWVSYDIEFYKPKLPSDNTTSEVAQFDLGSWPNSTSPLVNPTTTVYPVTGSSLSCYIDGSNQSLVINGPAGNYYVQWFAQFTNSTVFVVPPDITVLSGGSTTNTAPPWRNRVPYATQSETAISQGTFTQTISTVPLVLQFSGATLGTTVEGYLVVSRIADTSTLTLASKKNSSSLDTMKETLKKELLAELLGGNIREVLAELLKSEIEHSPVALRKRQKRVQPEAEDSSRHSDWSYDDVDPKTIDIELRKATPVSREANQGRNLSKDLGLKVVCK